MLARSDSQLLRENAENGKERILRVGVPTHESGP